jgi:hypothetical protein
MSKTHSPAPGSVLHYAAAATAATSGFLTPEEAAAPADLALDPSWRFYLIMQADAGVVTIREVGPHLPNLSFTDEALTEAKLRLMQVQSAKEALGAQMARLEGAEVLHKNRITSWVGELDQVLTSRRIDPTLPAPIKEAIATASAPFVSVAAHYQDAQTSARRTTLDLKQQLTAAQTSEAQKDLVIRSLQGDRLSAADLPPPPAPPAPRAPRAPRNGGRRSGTRR